MSIPAQSNFRKLLLLAVGLTCIAAFAIGLTIWWLRFDAIADASKESSNLAAIMHGVDCFSVPSTTSA